MASKLFKKKTNDDVTTGSMTDTKEEKESADQVPQDVVLYDRLMSTCSQKIQKQTNYLKESIDQLMKIQSEKENLLKVVNYKDFLICDKAIGLRQDSLKHFETEQELLSFPNKALFDEKELKELNMLNTYDSQVYLSQLFVAAKSLNEPFHKDMKKIFDISEDVARNSNFDLGISEYRAGPLKQRARCQAKAEHGYNNKSYPTTACLVDMVRCSVSVNNCGNLLKCMQKLKDYINSPNNKTCVKRIVRIKNKFSCNVLFQTNKKSAAKNGMDTDKDYSWLFQYGDIKFNLLVELNGKSLIVECQFLLSLMIKAKNMGHSLYEITRNDGFIRDMNHILGTQDIQEQLYVAVNSNNIRRIGQILLSYPNSIDLMKIDRKGLTVMHHACLNGYKKVIQLLLSQYDRKSEEFSKMLNARCQSTRRRTPLLYCCTYDRIDCIKLLLNFSETQADVLNQDGHLYYNEFAGSLDYAIQIHNSEITELILKHPTTKGYAFNKAFSVACELGAIDIVRMLMNKYSDKFDKVQLNGGMCKACSEGQVQVMEYLSTLENVDPNNSNIIEGSCLWQTISSKNIEAVKCLYRLYGNKLDWTIKTDDDKDIWSEIVQFRDFETLEYWDKLYKFLLDVNLTTKEIMEPHIKAYEELKSQQLLRTGSRDYSYAEIDSEQYDDDDDDDRDDIVPVSDDEQDDPDAVDKVIRKMMGKYDVAKVIMQ